MNRSLLLALAAFPTALLAQNSDLPFDSGSTGADGPFSIPELGPGGTGFGLAYHAVTDQIVRYAGRDQSAGGSINNKIWVWGADGWQEVSTYGNDRGDCVMAYHAAREEVLLFGGWKSGSPAQLDAHDAVWDGSTWASVSGSAPPGRTGHTMAYDSARQEIVLFGGGASVSNPGSSPLSDTWVWDGTWTQKTPATTPPAMWDHSMAFDEARGEMVVYRNGFKETWIWDGTDWAQRFPATIPGPAGISKAAMAYDAARQQVVLYGGQNGLDDTWIWDGTDWTKKSPNTVPPERHDHEMVYDSANQRILLVGGGAHTPGNSERTFETWAWDGTDWALLAGPDFIFDMTTDPDAVWDFTSIEIPAGVTVSFKRNAANDAVVWLASENVKIDGTIDLSGEDATEVGIQGTAGGRPRSGPGGFDGGLGGILGGDDATEGDGPGGGAAGTGSGGAGGHATDTGNNAFAIPLIGGSGGGGGAPSTMDGFKGGSGGGAILIASSKDITVNGTIQANPGARGSGSGGGYGGRGAGGTIRLVGDRVLATNGTFDTSGLNVAATDGRTRLEGYVREFTPANVEGSITASVPVEGDLLAQSAGRLRITNIAGNSVALEPGGDPLNPDVVFGETGAVTITVQATNIPEGTPVTLTIEHDTSGTIQVPAVNLSGGQTTFSTTIAAGNGTIQAFADYTVGGAP